MSNIVFSNATKTTLAAGIGAADVAMALADASTYPAPADGQHMRLVLGDPLDGPYEVVLATVRAVNTVSGLTRGQEGSPAAAWPVGTPVTLPMTAGGVADLRAELAPVGEIIATDVSFYLDPAGSDTTGDGSLYSPWHSLARVLQRLVGTIIAPTALVHIVCADGVFRNQPQVEIDHPYAHRIRIEATPADWIGVTNIYRLPAVWQAAHAYAVGDCVYPTTWNGYTYRCLRAATSGASEPAWQTWNSEFCISATCWNAAANDNGVIWQALPVGMAELTLSVDAVAGAEPDGYLWIGFASGGTTRPWAICGAPRIVSVDAVNNRLTVHLGPVMTAADLPGSDTTADAAVIRCAMQFDQPAAGAAIKWSGSLGHLGDIALACVVDTPTYPDLYSVGPVLSTHRAGVESYDNAQVLIGGVTISDSALQDWWPAIALPYGQSMRVNGGRNYFGTIRGRLECDSASVAVDAVMAGGASMANNGHLYCWDKVTRADAALACSERSHVYVGGVVAQAAAVDALTGSYVEVGAGGIVGTTNITVNTLSADGSYIKA